MNQDRVFTAIIVLLTLIIVVIGGLSFNPSAKFNNTTDVVKTDLNVPFTLNFNQTAVIDSQNLNITFKNVTEDSRCPSDVQCVWEGQVTVQINIKNNDQDLGTFNITKRAGHDDMSILNVNGYSITLENVEPYPVSTKKIAESDYSITLKIKKI